MSHCDPGYTAFPSEVKRKHVEYLREVIGLCRASERLSEGLRFKWTCEASWTVKEFLNNATGREKNDFFHFVRNRQIEIAGTFGTLLSEMSSYEELIRSCDYSVRLAKENNFRISTAIFNDVPGIAAGLPDVLSGYGIPYFLFGPNAFRSLVGWSELPKLFYLQSKSAGKVLVWHLGQDRRIPQAEMEGFGSEYGYGDSYLISPYRQMKGIADKGNLAFAERARLKGKGREALDKLLERLASENYPYDAILLECAADNRGPDRQMVSTIKALNRDFSDFSFILAVPGDFFSYIESKYHANIPTYSGVLTDAWSECAASMAVTTGLYRKYQREALVLEKALFFKKYDRKDTERMDRIYENLLSYSEHTFGLSGWRGFPDQMLEQSWDDKAFYVKEAERLIEETRKSHAISPSCQSSASRKAGKDIRLKRNSIENEYYRIAFSPKGIIRSIFDKELKKELVDKKSHFAFNEILFTEIKGLSPLPPKKGCGLFDKVETTPFTEHDRDDVVVEKKTGEVSYTHEFSLKKTPVKISGNVRIVLYSGLKRVDFINTVRKEENRAKEAIYFAFPFNLKKEFKTRMEMAYCLMDFPNDLLSGARSDLCAIQNFVSISDEDIALTWLTWDAPLVEIGEVRDFSWQGPEYQPCAPTILSHVMNNIWPTMCPHWQGGEFVFRYSLTSDSEFDPAQCYQFKQDVILPELSDLKIFPDHVFATGFKINRDKTMSIRLFETAGQDGTGRMKWKGVRNACLADLAGRKVAKLPVLKGEIYFPYHAHKLCNIEIAF